MRVSGRSPSSWVNSKNSIAPLLDGAPREDAQAPTCGAAACISARTGLRTTRPNTFAKKLEVSFGGRESLSHRIDRDMGAPPLTAPLDASGDRLRGLVEAPNHHLLTELCGLAARLLQMSLYLPPSGAGIDARTIDVIELALERHHAGPDAANRLRVAAKLDLWIDSADFHECLFSSRRMAKRTHRVRRGQRNIAAQHRDGSAGGPSDNSARRRETADYSDHAPGPVPSRRARAAMIAAAPWHPAGPPERTQPKFAPGLPAV